jgi:ribosomal protein S18 acetylase RimI-like enzyme
MPTLSFQLRPARADDHDFLWLLKQQTMRLYVEQTWGRWNDAEQKAWFSLKFLPEAVCIIVTGGRDAGRVEVTRNAEGIVLGTIEILPEFQGLGIGTAVIASLQTEARSTNLPLRLQVLKANPRAYRFYTRLGFKPLGETATHHLMSWQP